MDDLVVLRYDGVEDAYPVRVEIDGYYYSHRFRVESGGQLTVYRFIRHESRAVDVDHADEHVATYSSRGWIRVAGGPRVALGRAPTGT